MIFSSLLVNFLSDTYLFAYLFIDRYFRLGEGALEGSNFNGYRLTFIEFEIGENCNEDYFFVRTLQF